MSLRITTINVDNLIKEYLSGVSELQLSKNYGVDRGTIRKRLIENGVPRRGAKEASVFRYRDTTKEYRKSLTKKANEAMRGRTVPDDQRNKMAIALEKSLARQGRGEKYIYNLLSDRGYIGIAEKAVGRFNVDIAFGKIAVEIKVSTNNPMKIFDAKKIKYLCERGWNIFYVWVGEFRFLSESHADEIISFIEECRRTPSMAGEYRMIGRYGNVRARESFDCD